MRMGRKAHAASSTVERCAGRDYARRMLVRPHSTTFRLILALAMLAWTVLASGTPAISASALGATSGSAHVQTAAERAHCRAMAMTGAGMHHGHAPAAPAGHGDCCHAGCHCLFACSVMIGVPPVLPGFPRFRLEPTVVLLDGVPAMATVPPLRPPIA